MSGIGDTFWEEWSDRFDNSTHKFITPGHPLVVKESQKVNVKQSDSEVDRAFKVWLHVHDRIEYKLSRKWKTPEETLKSEIGDCEDVTFLMASMFSNLGIEEHSIVLGDLYFPDDSGEYHTWNVVDGVIMDATGPPEVVKTLTYDQRTRWILRSNTEVKKNGSR